jgi:hypothetical protein
MNPEHRQTPQFNVVTEALSRNTPIFNLKYGIDSRIAGLAVNVHQNCRQIHYDVYDININVSTITAATYDASR